MWFRKYGFFRSSSIYGEICSTKKLNEELVNQLTKEYSKIIETLVFALRDRNWLANPYYINLNKLEVLQKASACGLTVADTYIVNDLEEIGRAHV